MVDACTGIGLPPEKTQAMCMYGQCVFSASCNPSQVFCNGIPPECGPGTLPSVVDGCWGGCISSLDCFDVGSCDQCSDSQACVAAGGGGPAINSHFQCLPVATACNGVPDCQCMGNDVCQADGSGIVCSELDLPHPSFSCECPMCATP